MLTRHRKAAFDRRGRQMIPERVGPDVSDRPASRRRALRRRAVVGASLFFASFLLISYRNYNKGIFYYDEAYNLLEARFIYESAKRAVGYVALRAGSRAQAPAFRDYVKSRGKPDGQYLRYGKPLHTLILAAGLTASAGELWGPYAAMALMGAGTVALTFLVGRSLGSRRTGIAAAVLLAGSGYFLNYAREALAEIDSAFLYLLSAWIYLPALFSRQGRGRGWRLFAAGSCAGLAFAANYRWFWIPLVFLTMEAHQWRATPSRVEGRKGARVFVARSGAILSGFFLVLLLFEIPFRCAAIYFRGQGLALPFETYFEQLARLYFFHPTSQKSFDLAGPQTYFYLIWKLQSPIVLGLLGAGLWDVLRRGRPAGCLWLVLLSAAPIAFYSFYALKFARFLSLSLPFLAMVEARGLEWIVRLSYRRQYNTTRAVRVWSVLLAALALAQLWRAWPVFSLRSPYAAVHRDLAALGQRRCLSTEAYISRWHAGRDNVEFPPDSWTELQARARDGYRYVIVGPLAYYGGGLESLTRLERAETPVKVYPNPAGGYFLYRFEHNRDFRRTLKGLDFPDPGVVKLYRLPF